MSKYVHHPPCFQWSYFSIAYYLAENTSLLLTYINSIMGRWFIRAVMTYQFVSFVLVTKWEILCHCRRKEQSTELTNYSILNLNCHMPFPLIAYWSELVSYSRELQGVRKLFEWTIKRRDSNIGKHPKCRKKKWSESRKEILLKCYLSENNFTLSSVLFGSLCQY
jgi:hypothetical protein